MASRTCVGCREQLTNDLRSREHILPQWLAAEVEIPELDLKHYLHDEDEKTDALLRSHGLGSYAIKNVCSKCNNGWMSRLEDRAKPLLLELMNMRASLLQLTEEQRTTISAWAIKTAFMIASAQKSVGNLPWNLFRQLAETPEGVPAECFAVAAQLPFLPKGFLYACPGDVLPQYQDPVSIRVGFPAHHLHFVVILPCLDAQRLVRTSGVHIPIWPLDLEIIVRYENFPTITVPGELINFLTGLVQAGIVRTRGGPASTE